MFMFDRNGNVVTHGSIIRYCGEPLEPLSNGRKRGYLGVAIFTPMGMKMRCVDENGVYDNGLLWEYEDTPMYDCVVVR